MRQPRLQSVGCRVLAQRFRPPSSGRIKGLQGREPAMMCSSMRYHCRHSYLGNVPVQLQLQLGPGRGPCAATKLRAHAHGKNPYMYMYWTQGPPEQMRGVLRSPSSCILHNLFYSNKLRQPAPREKNLKSLVPRHITALYRCAAARPLRLRFRLSSR